MDQDPQFQSEDGVALRIWKDVAKNNFQSEEHGRAIYDEVIYVEVIAPGSRGSTPIFEVERIWCKEAGIKTPQRSPQYEQYEKSIKSFKEHDEGTVSMSGTPLKEWPEISRSMAASLREARIFTVEGLANVPDTALQLIGPDGRSWREKAIAFISKAQDSAYTTQIAAELQRTKDDLADKDYQIRTLSERLGELERAAVEKQSYKKYDAYDEEVQPSKVLETEKPRGIQPAPPHPTISEAAKGKNKVV